MNRTNVTCVATILLCVLAATVGLAGSVAGSEPLDLTRDKVCHVDGSGAKRCVYLGAKNEDGVQCLLGTDDDDNRSQSDYYEYCLKQG